MRVQWEDYKTVNGGLTLAIRRSEIMKNPTFIFSAERVEDKGDKLCVQEKVL